MPKTKFYAYYQDFVCGSTLRIARELFALLPLSMVIVTAESDILNTSTGHKDMQPILSVAIPHSTLDKLNMHHIDPSDSMSNFIHNMVFKKTKGFSAVSKVSRDELDLEHKLVNSSEELPEDR